MSDKLEDKVATKTRGKAEIIIGDTIMALSASIPIITTLNYCFQKEFSIEATLEYILTTGVMGVAVFGVGKVVKKIGEIKKEYFDKYKIEI